MSRTSFPFHANFVFRFFCLVLFDCTITNIYGEFYLIVFWAVRVNTIKLRPLLRGYPRQSFFQELTLKDFYFCVDTHNRSISGSDGTRTRTSNLVGYSTIMDSIGGHVHLPRHSPFLSYRPKLAPHKPRRKKVKDVLYIRFS